MNSDALLAPSAALTDSRLATVCARTVEEAFVDYQRRFHEITQRARRRFLDRDWAASYADAAERLHLYSKVVNGLTDQIKTLMGPRLSQRDSWAAIKAVYSSLIANSSQWEVAESFFNSLTRRVFATAGVDQAMEFVDTDFDAPPASSRTSVTRSYTANTLDELVFSALSDPKDGGFGEECWHKLADAAELAAERIATAFSKASLATDGSDNSGRFRLELIGKAFYRGRGAYLVGRCIFGDGEDKAVPLAFCLQHGDKQGINLDAVLLGETDLSILFSYTRAYFRVEAECPYELVRYLRELMPHKRLVDLYNSIGYPRHGKTEFYRDFVAHLRTSQDCFVEAEGARGMVMLVFTLPSYDVVFKLIKDRFDYPKESSREDVMRRYRLVFEHDRAGRLVEAHEFEHLRIAKERFDPALLKHLLGEAASTVSEETNDIVISHAYIERRIRPLNLFFKETHAADCAAAGYDYGQAIKDMAASNIFPGDLLIKNFGVTRSSRVVFYDYDELCFLTDCNFRDLPQATTHEEEMSAEPWFSVRENDIFPEEFPRFLGLPGPARDALFERHADLFHPDFWRGLQQKLRAGEILEVFPYSQERRLSTS